MPRPATRQRIVYCDCFDCIENPDTAVRSQAEVAAADAVAQQKPPPKCIWLLGSGLLSSLEGVTSLEDCTIPHMDKAAREGCIGIAAVRSSTVSGTLEPCLHELSQLLESHQVISELDASIWQNCDESAVPGVQALDSRYKGLEVVAASSSAPCRKLLQSAGAAVPAELQLQAHPAPPTEGDADAGSTTQADDSAAQQPAEAWCGQSLGLPAPAAYATQLLTCLEIEQGQSGPDMALVHLDVHDLCHNTSDDAGLQDAACSGLLWLDALLAQLMTHQPVRERVLLSVLVTPQGRACLPAAVQDGGSNASKGAGLAQQQPTPLLSPGVMLDPNVHVVTPRDMSAVLKGQSGAVRDLDKAVRSSVPRPLQSWQFRGLDRVEVAMDAPALYLRRLPGVVRKDRAVKFTLEEAVAKGGMGAILIDRLLPEMAYKLGRASKYGA